MSFKELLCLQKLSILIFGLGFCLSSKKFQSQKSFLKIVFKKMSGFQTRSIFGSKFFLDIIKKPHFFEFLWHWVLIFFNEAFFSKYFSSCRKHHLKTFLKALFHFWELFMFENYIQFISKLLHLKFTFCFHENTWKPLKYEFLHSFHNSYTKSSIPRFLFKFTIVFSSL